jgi:DNA-binding ferritin-like protein
MEENEIKEIKEKVERLYRDYREKMQELAREGERDTEYFLNEIEKLTRS